MGKTYITRYYCDMCGNDTKEPIQFNPYDDPNVQNRKITLKFTGFIPRKDSVPPVKDDAHVCSSCAKMALTAALNSLNQS